MEQQFFSPPEQWVDKYGDYLYGYALMRLRDPIVAEDVVQETLLAALTARQTFAGKSSEKTWLVGILKHKIIDYFRKKKRETPMSETMPQWEQDQFFAGDGELDGHWQPQAKPQQWGTDLPSPLDVAEQKDFWRVFYSCLDKLPERVATIFSMKEFDEMETQEICKVLDITETNLWVILHRARLNLRRCLEVRWFRKPGLEE